MRKRASLTNPEKRKILLIFLFATSTYADELWGWIPYLCNKVSVSALKCTPLSEISLWGTLYRQIMCDMMKLATTTNFNLAYEAALMATKMNSWPLEDFSEIFPMISIPYTENGHGQVNACSSKGGMWMRSPCIWHFGHLWTNWQQSVSIVN